MKLLSSITQLKVSWLESIMLFKPVSLKLFFLVTLKSVKELWKIIHHGWYPLLSFLLFVYLIFFRRVQENVQSTKRVWTFTTLERAEDFFFLLFGAFIVSFLIQAVRPSIDYKDKEYWSLYGLLYLKLFALVFFVFYLPYAYLTAQPIDFMTLAIVLLALLIPPAFGSKRSRIEEGVIVFFIIVIVTIVIPAYLGKEYIVFSPPSFPFASLLRTNLLRIFFIDEVWLKSYISTCTYFVSPLVITSALFLFDAQKTFYDYLKAFLRAITMVIYNYPFFLITYTTFYFFVILIHAISSWILPSWYAWQIIGWSSFVFLLLPFYICFITNFYIKRIHEQFSLYYR